VSYLLITFLLFCILLVWFLLVIAFLSVFLHYSTCIFFPLSSFPLHLLGIVFIQHQHADALYPFGVELLIGSLTRSDAESPS
jgi:hypothetical protein